MSSLLRLVFVATIFLVGSDFVAGTGFVTGTGALAAPQAPKKVLHSYKPGKAFEGFTLYPIEGNAQVQLLNMKGQVVHRWALDAERAKLLPSGRLLATIGSNWGKNRAPWKDLRNLIREYSWDGQVVWEYKAEDTVARYFERLKNGNTIFLMRVLIPLDIVRKTLGDSGPKDQLRGDAVVEIDPEQKMVWSWKAHEHLSLNDCGKRTCRWSDPQRKVGDRDDWTHGNTASVIPDNKWYDAGDKRFKPGNILYMPRNFSQVLLIDRETGNELWRYDGDYKGGLGGGHEPLMIAKGLPGAGNVLMFDNWSEEFPGQSHVIEFNPVTKKVEWVFDQGQRLYSETSGACQRLPNGNTIVSEDNRGRVLEVTREGEVVWEYDAAKEINRAQRYPVTYAPRFAALPQ